MPVANSGLLATGCEALQSEGPDRLQHAETRLRLSLVDAADEARLDQRRQSLQDSRPIALRIDNRIDNRVGCLARPSADEDRQLPEDALLGLTQQVVAPGDRRLHGLLSRGEAAG